MRTGRYVQKAQAWVNRAKKSEFRDDPTQDQLRSWVMDKFPYLLDETVEDIVGKVQL